MFVAVMEAGSFARAAERLRTSAGQASKLISRLEGELGVRLLNRTTRALAATEAGQAYFERVRVLLADFDALEEAVRNVSGTPKGRLRMTAPVSFGAAQLASVLVEFARQFPQIELDVSFSDRVVSLVDEGFDAAIRIGSPADSSLIARHLCEARIVVCASEAYVQEHEVPRTPIGLKSHNCIIDTNFREPGIWAFREPDGSDTLIEVAGRLRFSNADVALTAAEAGLGVARAPSFIAGPRFRAGRLVPLLRGFEPKPLGIYALYPPGRHLAIKVRLLVDFLVAHYRSGPDWDKGW
ncbi:MULTISPECIES: LysR family transcriptional regulator [Aminobacter]|jgi:DNA-binding transcriptional LysR family regulator|uniref:DNA-binding transcriptional LysR family regulator n=1 Tax=Aminobacter ciceronei TaxID=150723 RepID=A0ABR6CHW6_9HYPH|nr:MULTISPECIES: LysR family transcriptional regulator [Aminobacter]MBA8910830.1 DNA-binding transcriptional LysR family regulator [Aminobacter ciceronei]MBA9024603.1 DNA-binding transcriptional LysR family regulator [Aminobacter ciceronei]